MLALITLSITFLCFSRSEMPCISQWLNPSDAIWYPVTYFPPLRKHRPDVLKSYTYHPIIKLTITQMYTHFTQLYIAGNFPYLTDVVRISGREWGPTRPSHHLNLLFHSCCFCHFGQSKQSLTKCNVFPISKCPALSTYSFESQSSPVQLITLKATYLPNIL